MMNPLDIDYDPREAPRPLTEAEAEAAKANRTTGRYGSEPVRKKCAVWCRPGARCGRGASCKAPVPVDPGRQTTWGQPARKVPEPPDPNRLHPQSKESVAFDKRTREQRDEEAEWAALARDLREES